MIQRVQVKNKHTAYILPVQARYALDDQDKKKPVFMHRPQACRGHPGNRRQNHSATLDLAANNFIIRRQIYLFLPTFGGQ
ncbi:MAG: hypothetical protein ABIQ88_15195 [Chitinophagaceae bacterium]